MNFEYDIGFEDLHRIDLAFVELNHMSLWLRHVAGIVLGPIGILMMWFVIPELRHPSQSSGLVGSIFALLIALFFTWLLVVALWYSGWNMRRRLRGRIRLSPRLVGKRSLYLTPQGLCETDYIAFHDFVSEADFEAHVRDHVFQFIEWTDLRRVQETPKDIMLFAKSGQAIIVPIGGEPPGEVQAFREEISANWNSAKTGQPLPSKEGVWPPPPRIGE